MKTRLNVILAIIILLIASLILLNPHSPLATEDIRFVRIGETKVEVELALTTEARAQGLSGRITLDEGKGLLFVFERPGDYSFWMKDMNFAIDIIWIAEVSGDKKIVYIKKDARPESYPETFKPSEDAKYVLEVISGFADKHKLKEGDSVRFTY